jgi:hypothetical protein
LGALQTSLFTAHGGGVKKSCSSSDVSCMEEVCVPTNDVAFHVVDAYMWGFRDACYAHHLQNEQGDPRKASTHTEHIF